MTPEEVALVVERLRHLTKSLPWTETVMIRTDDMEKVRIVLDALEELEAEAAGWKEKCGELRKQADAALDQRDRLEALCREYADLLSAYLDNDTYPGVAERDTLYDRIEEAVGPRGEVKR